MMSGEDLSLEQFEILEKIGQGSFGLVFKARHRVSQKFYALKKVFIKFLLFQSNIDLGKFFIWDI